MYEVKGQDPETTQNMEGQWSAALWDGSATVHAKESQLQLVTQYHRQTLAAKATLEKLVAKLEELRNGPVESSLLEAEKLHAVLRDLEQERAVIGELLQTQTKLSPHLSQAERVMSHTQLGHLQEEWRALERVAEKMLHHVSVTNQETGGLLLEVQELQSHLKTLQKSLGPAQPSEEQWDSQRAGQLMIIGAALKAANQNYLHLQQQTSDAHSQSLQGEKERADIEQALLHVKEQLESLQRQVSTQSPSSSNATLGKIMKVMQDAFTWAKQKESNIEARKKVALLPEAVHSQIKGLKKLQSEISSKQSQLESLVEEVRELIPELDKKDVPMVLNSLKTLEGLSKSTSEKLAQALQEMESGLQVREKMSEQIADVDSWVVAHVHKETIRESNGKSSTLDLERKLRQLQETLKEADKQAAVTEALLMRSRDIAPELSIVENCLLNDKLTSLHEDIKGIINYEKTNCQELEELLLAQDSSFKKVSSVETILRQVSVDLNRFRFPITKDSLSAVEKVEHVILEQKCQVDQMRQCKEDKSRELLCTIAEMQNKVNALSQKAEQHERYLSYRQHVEDLKVDVEAQVLKMKDENIRKEERYKNCQALLIQLPLIKSLCQAAAVELEDISRDLYPSQLSSERQRLRQVTESLSTWEMTVQNDSNILEWALLKNLHYPTERKAMVEFLKQANLELDKPTKVGLEEQAIDREFLKWATLQRNVECRTRVLEFLEHSTEARQKGWEQENTDMADLRRKTVNGCTKRMEYLSQAKEILRVYNTAVRGAVRFLQEVESRLLLPLDCAGSCPEQLKHTQQALAFLNEKFQSHITEIHALLPQHTCLSSDNAEQLHSTILSQLLVRISTLQAQAQVRMETFQRCAKKQRVYRRCHKEICQHLNTVETTLSECITHNATSYRACLDQQEKLEVLVHELKSLAERLEELGEWCPEQGCSGGREEAVSALWRLWARLQRCALYLKARSDQRGAEWKDITKSVERATIILDQLQDELPDCTREKASLDELQEMLVYTEQYQDRLDCEHRSLMALELRVARLLGVPAHQEHSPPIPLCQELQTMQGRYKNLKEKSMLGQQAVQLEVQERERVKEEISGVKEWLVAAVSLLSVMEDLPSTEELQEVQTQLGSQKAVLQSIMDGLRMKYSDMYTLVPIEIDGPLQEVTRSLKEVEEKVGEAVEKSGPLCRLGGRVEEIRLGLQSVLALLEQRSLTPAEAESKQKRLWDELDGWHSRMAALEVEVHDIAEEHPEEAHILTDKLMETRELYQHVAKQAEQRTAFLSRIHTCLQEHEEMIKSSSSWLSEAHAWLTAPCTFTTAKCLSSHASALQMVLEDSEQMRRTLQGFVAVLQDVSSVCDMTALQEQLAQADQRVAIMQESIAAQLSQFQHAAAEVDAIETEVERMEKNLNKFRDILSSEDSTPQSTEEHLRNMQMILGDIESMKRIMAEIQSCKPGLGLPEEAEETMTTFQRAEHLLEQIRAIGQMINEQNPTVKLDISQSVEPEKLSTLEEVIESSPTLSIPGELQLTTGQSVEPEKPSTSASEEVIVPSPTLPSLSIPGELQLTIGQSVESGELPPSASEEVIVPSPTLSIPGELQQADTEEGRIQIVHVEEDVLKRSGAALLTVQGSSPAQRESWGSERTTQDLWNMSLSEEDEDDRSSNSSSSETLTGSVPEDPDEILIGEEQTGVSSASLEQSLERDEVFQPHPDSAAQDIVGITLTEGASVTGEDLSKPVATVRTQALPQSMVNKSPSVNLSKTSTKPQQKCTIS
ncbi:hypothetical protein AGOR_G00105680 [Albula goreensis]|uniref:KASH domain-containing protein n=1 Tax=Albula goreensis TaxID=1534307 RepID=A0A8T3DD55_9TELE|nr:hypothetical protein AGOR_G00105680 [Albula goreensis]